MTFERVVDAGRKMVFGAATSGPSVIEGEGQRIVLELDGGETLDVDSQIQLYAPNNLLSHPLISHCGAYLGGLPPLFFIAGEQEVLRDEIIYTFVVSRLPSLTQLTCVPGLTEQQILPSSRSQIRPNDSIRRSRK